MRRVGSQVAMWFVTVALVVGYYLIIPYKHVTQAGPTRLEAEDFINYSDTSGGNAGGAYRQTDVDIEVGGSTNFSVSWTDPGEWLDHGVTCVDPEMYGFIHNYATTSGGRTMSLDIDGSPAGTTHLLNTGGWGSFQDAPAIYAPLAAGHHLLRTTFDNGSANFDYLNIIPLGHARAIGRSASFEAEGYDRFHGVLIGPDAGASGGEYVGWVDSGEWIAFDLLVGQDGIYKVVGTLATPINGREVAVYLDGLLENTITVDSTGGWDQWAEFELGRFNLTAGYHEFRALSVNGSINFDVFQVDLIPEPATMALLGLGCLALLRRRRRKA